MSDNYGMTHRRKNDPTQKMKNVINMAKAELPLAPIDRLVRKAGAGRVSAEAAESLRDILQDVATDIGKVAVEFAKHAKRKTVVEDDIKLAYDQWKR